MRTPWSTRRPFAASLVGLAVAEPAAPDERSIVLAGGGSGGHVFPALAVADELRARGWSSSWVGAPDSMEERLVRQRRLDFRPLGAAPFVGRGRMQRLLALGRLSASALRARSLVRSLRAAVVLGTGGYVSAPAVLGARLAGVPVLLIEPNAEAGLANRQLSRFAQRAAIAHPSTAAQLRCPSVVTGVPVGAAFFDARPVSELEGPLRLLVLGGSQGAAALNAAIPRTLRLLHDRRATPWRVTHQTGDDQLDSTLEHYRDAAVDDDTPRADAAFSLAGSQVELRPFIDDVAAAMADHHLVVSRAGAITLAEICAAGRPSLLAPLAAAGDHQRANAQALVDADAALMPDSGPESLAEALAELSGQPQRLESMGEAARSLAHENASQAIADQVLELAGERGR